MAKVFVDGDLEVLGRISAALEAAGLSSVGIEPVERPREITRFPSAPGNWAAFADLATDLTYAEWREELLSL
jgi:hypothetical protein